MKRSPKKIAEETFEKLVLQPSYGGAVPDMVRMTCRLFEDGTTSEAFYHHIQPPGKETYWAEVPAFRTGVLSRLSRDFASEINSFRERQA